ncbi:hypothetical protein ASZ90_018325 [hydrocarbon metagenome]|uniref:Uncharacterized protein n=1 Tax=hydrocarbon metagenome TaxID=938273 RepID=A0A0W8E6P4_9ZZZZ
MGGGFAPAFSTARYFNYSGKRNGHDLAASFSARDMVVNSFLAGDSFHVRSGLVHLCTL